MLLYTVQSTILINNLSVNYFIVILKVYYGLYSMLLAIE